MNYEFRIATPASAVKKLQITMYKLQMLHPLAREVQPVTLNEVKGLAKRKCGFA